MNLNAAPQDVSVVELVSQARESAMQALADYTGIEIEELFELPEIVTVMQSIPPQLVDNVGLATLGEFATRRGCEPNSDGARYWYRVFDKVIAANIAAATNLVLQNLREQQMRQAETQRKLSSGLLGH